MPVSFSPVRIPANSLQSSSLDDLSPSDIFRGSCFNQYQKSSEIVQSSFAQRGSTAARIVPSPNGFVHTVAEAYNHHHALVIRPDDVWLVILTQFNFFVNGNAEVLRSKFVAHEGKKDIKVHMNATLDTVDFGSMAKEMTREMEKVIIDPTLRSWILPDFTTTTQNDTVVCCMVMMATLKEYFAYEFCLDCGIPRVTLEGEKQDWEKIFYRLEKLKEYGLHTIAWYHLLVPVVSQFVKAFDDPNGEENLDFWSKVVHYQGGGSGPMWLAGWITAFCVFDDAGKWLGNSFVENVSPSVDATFLSSKEFSERFLIDASASFIRPFMSTTRSLDSDSDEESEFETCLILDDTLYHRIDTDDIPAAYAECDVKLCLDHEEDFDAMITAGLVGRLVCSSREEGDGRQMSESGENDSLRPVSGWWLVRKLPEGEIREQDA